MDSADDLDFFPFGQEPTTPPPAKPERSRDAATADRDNRRVCKARRKSRSKVASRR